MTLPVLSQQVEQNILLIRGHRVMLDADLAKLYGVSTKRLNEQVQRNKKRFPSDFMFQLTPEEVERLRSQIATSKIGSGGRRYRPYAFTEQGVAMLSSVLHSERAIQVNIAIMRAFVQLREMISSNKGLARRLNELEKKYEGTARCPPCSQNARPRKALVRCAQSRATLATPLWKGRERRRTGDHPSWSCTPGTEEGMEPDDLLCSRNAPGFVCLVGWSFRSVWFFRMNSQSDQPNNPDRRDRPNEQAFVRRAQWKINQAPSLGRTSELGVNI